MRNQSEDYCLPQNVLVYRDRKGGGYNVTRAIDEATLGAKAPVVDVICTPALKSLEASGIEPYQGTDGGRVREDDEGHSALENFNYVGSRHHY